ncbi:glycosyltransferase family 4 protein [Kitasatospora sp. NPDC048365]|uniref:glycosyltransferase family 4 protein n=1 Tax=Kitasatospora sp. NPDC048365 TaxID=3364050 RepID=UPI003722AB1B
MRIAIVAGEPGPAEGQAPDRLAALAQALTGRGHRVELATRASPARLAERTADRVADLPLPHVPVTALYAGRPDAVGTGAVLRSTPAWADALAACWHPDPPAVVHACGPDAALAALSAARRIPDLPVVVERATDLPGTPDRDPDSATRLRLLRGLLAREADLLLARTRWEAALLRRLGAAYHRVAVVPLPVDTSRFAPAALLGNGGPPHLLNLDGGRSPEAVPLLSAALRRLPGVLLTVAGGPRTASRGQLRRLPETAHRKVPGLLAAADVLVAVPSRAAGGAAVLEAMACAVPVVAVENGPVGELVVDGVTGLLVPPGRPALLAGTVRDLLADPAFAQALGIAGADRARALHTWPLAAEHLDTLYPAVHPVA